MSLYQRIDDMTWPAPGDALDDLEWRLRHGDSVARVGAACTAASVVAAYRELVLCPRVKRERIVRALRAQAEEAQT